MSQEMKSRYSPLCKDCLHLGDIGRKKDKCLRPIVKQVDDPVYGARTISYPLLRYAENERNNSICNDVCGLGAKYFEAKV